MPFSAIYITYPNYEEAQRISDILIGERLAACVNIFAIKSSYWWHGVVEVEDEWVGLLKTSNLLWEKIQHRVQELHSYDVPCIVRYQVEANPDYETWIEKEVELASATKNKPDP